MHSCGGVNGAGGLGMKLLYGGLSLRREADGTDGSMVLL